MMATETIKHQLFADFNPNSKIWIYSANRELTEFESNAIREQLIAFTKQWTAHDIALKGAGEVLYNRFLILAVDETQTNASGCSIDKSVHFIKSLETQYTLNLFDRLTIFYLENGILKSFHFNDLQMLIKSETISAETTIFDTTITSLDKLQNAFLVKAKNSWLAKYFN